MTDVLFRFDVDAAPGAVLDPVTVRWDVASRDDGSTVSFRHAGFSDDEEAGRVSYAWGQIMVRLKEYAETGSPDPGFA